MVAQPMRRVARSAGILLVPMQEGPAFLVEARSRREAGATVPAVHLDMSKIKVQ